jgi:endonuclease YncB( thermonuclease family)
MRRYGWLGLLAVLLTALLAARTRLLPTTEDRRPPDAAPGTSFVARVARVQDGDSVKLEDGRTVRYIGIDCPERGEPFAGEAAALNRSLVEGRVVRFETDREAADRYGRLLAYAFVEGRAESVSEILAERGLATHYRVPPNVARDGEIREAQDRARAAGHGIWASESAKPETHYVGSTGRFHRPSCVHAKAIRRPVRFETRAAALDAGKSPCRACRP